MPPLEPEAGVVVEPKIPLDITTEPPSVWFCGGVLLAETPRPYGTRWIVRSVSSSQASAQAPRTEAERYFAEWLGEIEEPTILFQVESADR
jgi:hypothetical protein